MCNRISVIVPVYMVERYLNCCVESIVGQTYSNLEIILVDDGSLDSCPMLCDEWTKKDSRIRVIHKPNGGLSDARNAGMAVATGDYIGFVDSDDWIAPDFYETMLNAMIANHAQIAAADVVLAYEDHEERNKRYEQTLFTPQQALETLMKGNGFHATAWNKLYRADIIRQFSYPVGKLHEDEFVTYKAISKAERLVLCQNTAYYYRQRKGSIMNTVCEKHLDAIDAFLERLEFFCTNYPELYMKDKPFFCIMLVRYYKETIKNSSASAQQIRNRLAQYRKMVHYTLRDISNYSVKQKIYVVGTALDLNTFSKLLVKWG